MEEIVKDIVNFGPIRRVGGGFVAYRPRADKRNELSKCVIPYIDLQLLDFFFISTATECRSDILMSSESIPGFFLESNQFGRVTGTRHISDTRLILPLEIWVGQTTLTPHICDVRLTYYHTYHVMCTVAHKGHHMYKLFFLD